MEQFTFLIANGIGFLLKRYTPMRKIIPWIVVASVFLTNVVKALVSGEADPISVSDGTVGMIAFMSWGSITSFLLPVAKESAYALGMHTFGKNAVMQGLIPILFKKQPAARRR